MSFQPYDPGVLPTKSPPEGGSSIVITLSGLPPYKDVHRSIRNIKHPRYSSFTALRKAATTAMDGRTSYRRALGVSLTIWAPALHKNRSMIDYLGGITDTLDGSHGMSFTYLPIVYEDDCQVTDINMRFISADNEKYELKIDFLSEDMYFGVL